MIKKILISILTLFCTASIYADETVLYWDATNSKVISIVDGFTLTGASGKVQAGSNNIALNEKNYLVIKLSANNEFTITPAEHKAIKEVKLYVVTNDASTKSSITFDDESTSTTVESLKDYTSPTEVTKSYIDPVTSVKFKVGGKQVCLVAFVTYSDKRGVRGEELYAVKKNGTALTKDQDYTVDNSNFIITLAASHKSAAVPADGYYKLVKRITYVTDDTEDSDFDVNGFSKDGEYWVSSETAIYTQGSKYRVKVPVNSEAELNISTSSVEKMTGMKSYDTQIGKVTVTGANLTDGTYNITLDNTDIKVYPTTFTVKDGTVSQEVTVYVASYAATGTANIKFDYTPNSNLAKTCVAKYERAAKGETTRSDVTGSTTWDWTQTGATTIQLLEIDNYLTEPCKVGEGTLPWVLSEIGEINNNADFNSQALEVLCEYPVRDGKYFQGSHVYFWPAVDGTLQVIYSHTSSSKGTRAVRVEQDGALSTDKTDSQGSSQSSGGDLSKMRTSDTFDIEENAWVTISAKQIGTYEEPNKYPMLQIAKIIFTATGTAINEVNGDTGVKTKNVKVARNGQITIGDYNIMGQRVK